MTRRTLITLSATAALLLGPAAAAHAATSTSTVSGVIGTELSLAIASPAGMTITHATPGSTSSLVTVTSTNLSWTLSIKDAAASNAGHMYLVSSPTTVLTNPLEWSNNGGSSYSNLSGTNATVKSGSLVDTATVTYRQTLGAAENVTAADVYNLVATFTVT